MTLREVPVKRAAKTNSKAVFLIMLVFSIGINGYLGYQLLSLRLRIAFASEQIETFHQIKNSFSEDRMDLDTAVEAVRTYYPSGTKQHHGTLLDKQVEECREFVIRVMEKIKMADAN